MEVEDLLVLREDNVRTDIVGDGVQFEAPAEPADLAVFFEDQRITLEEVRQGESGDSSSEDDRAHATLLNGAGAESLRPSRDGPARRGFPASRTPQNYRTWKRAVPEGTVA
jgi:hypothetical protein